MHLIYFYSKLQPLIPLERLNPKRRKIDFFNGLKIEIFTYNFNLKSIGMIYDTINMFCNPSIIKNIK